jgi:hypothetical protein
VIELFGVCPEERVPDCLDGLGGSWTDDLWDDLLESRDRGRSWEGGTWMECLVFCWEERAAATPCAKLAEGAEGGGRPDLDDDLDEGRDTCALCDPGTGG